MGVLSTDVDDLRRPGTDEPFAQALQTCMSGAPPPGTEADAATAAAEGARRKKIVQDGDGADRRRAFGQLYEELGELAFRYYFVIPSYCLPRRGSNRGRAYHLCRAPPTFGRMLGQTSS